MLADHINKENFSSFIDNKKREMHVYASYWIGDNKLSLSFNFDGVYLVQIGTVILYNGNSKPMAILHYNRFSTNARKNQTH